MLAYCTLFDSNYLDKGITMYKSLRKWSKDFCLYILAMDDLCLKILSELNLPFVTVISQKEFEDEELLRIKEERSRAEYCWTCTASLIDYVFEKYNEEYCTYVDSDIFFFQDPKILVDEMVTKGLSVQIVEHGFGTGGRAKRREKASGKYCVQFNTFKNDTNGRMVLGCWNDQCRNRCSMANDEMGDQKYLTDWAERYTCVHVLKNPGGGIAPWNIGRFRYVDNNGVLCLKEKLTGKVFEIVFYHFHHLEFIDNRTVNINVFKYNLKPDIRLVNQIYEAYLKELEKEKDMLQRCFDFTPMVKKHTGIQKNTIVQKLNKIISNKPIILLDMFYEKYLYIAGQKEDVVKLKERVEYKKEDE